MVEVGLDWIELKLGWKLGWVVTKNNQSGDPSGLISELFKPGVMGQDLAHSLLDLLNGIKAELFIPEQLKLANITTIYKNKGSRLDLKNDRGIFILSIFRKTLDKKCPKADIYISTTGIANQSESDHNTIYAVFNLKYSGKQPVVKKNCSTFTARSH